MRRLRAFSMVLVCAFILSGCGPRHSAAPAAGNANLAPPAAGAVVPKTTGPVQPTAAVPVAQATSRPSATYTVQAGDVLSSIAVHYGVDVADIVSANNLVDPDSLSIGQELTIPSVAGAALAPTAAARAGAPTVVPASAQVPIAGASGKAGSNQAVAPLERVASDGGRGSAYDRLSFAAQVAPEDSPYHNVTWVAYYGRPNVPLLGILGEYSMDDLVPRLRKQAAAYDEANGPELGVMPAFHLIYGMATAFTDDDGSYLSYMADSETKAYIDRANQEKFGVILDVQIGALTPLGALQPAFHWLQDGNVQLAIDPEFAMSEPGQTVPGQPPGTVTAEQINAVQAAMSAYMEENGISGHRILIVHQFLPWMIDDKADLYRYKGVDLTVCADGFGDPPTKVSKYNDFIHENVPFAAYKLFYGWDEPLMTEREALGVDASPGIDYMQETPNLIIYQ